MASILKEIYSKCLGLENDISKEISKLNSYPIDTIDKVKQKIEESLDNFKNSIELLNISIEKLNISTQEKDIWKRKKELFDSSLKNLNKRLDSIYNIKKRNHFNFDEENNSEFGKNINNLEMEKQSWTSAFRMSNEIYDTTINVNNELNEQMLSLSNIGGKITNIFQKMTGSYNDSAWIKQRGRNDKYICIALGILTTFIIGFTYFYLRPKIRG